MIEWGALSKTLGYDTPEEMWKDLYDGKKLSIAQISKKLDVSRNVVRLELDKAGCTIRKRGGPNNACVVITEDLLDEIRKNGVVLTAKSHNMDYTTLYKRLRLRGISVKSLREGGGLNPDAGGGTTQGEGGVEDSKELVAGTDGVEDGSGTPTLPKN